jgi:hypothetical protein
MIAYQRAIAVGNMNQSETQSQFEEFRRERMRRWKISKRSHPVGPQSEVRSLVDAHEARESQDRCLNTEAGDFFAHARESVASVVGDVSELRQRDVSDQLLREMEEFLVESVCRANKLMTALGLNMNHAGEARLSASLGNLDSGDLDAFRAAGTARLEDKHFGKDPLRIRSIAAVDSDMRGLPKIRHDIVVENVDGHSTASSENVPVCRCSLAESKMNPAGNGAGQTRLSKLRNGLIAMVRQGIMTKAEAQAIYLEQHRTPRSDSLYVSEIVRAIQRAGAIISRIADASGHRPQASASKPV